MKPIIGAVTFSLLVAVVILTGCQFAAPVTEAIYETTAAEMAALLPGTVSPLGLSAGNATDVAGMTVVVAGEDIYGMYQDPLAIADLTLDGDEVWRGIIPGLPIGPVLTFTVIAYDAADNEIFSGVTVQTLTGAGDEVSVTLKPVEAVAAVTFPIITQIARAGEMVNGSVGNSVSVDVRGSTDEQLSYVFTSGGGSFTPDSGTVDLPSSGVGTFISGYDAPAAIGEYPQSVRVENSQGNSVITNFPTIVVHGTTSVGMEMNFAPSVVGLSAQRIGDAVIWEADVTDDGPATELGYLWEYDGALVFADATQNPAELLGYDETQEGIVTLTVSDGDGLSTTVSFGLVAEQFPDALVTTNIPNGFGQLLLGGSDDDQATSVRQTIDGGYIVAGYSRSTDIVGTTNNGGYDIYVVKLDELGAIVWQVLVGGSGDDYASSLQQTTDGGYIIAGSSDSTDVFGAVSHGGFDAYVVKLSVTGFVEWQRLIGGSSYDFGRSVHRKTGGGYIVVGSSDSSDILGTVRNGYQDCYIVELAEDGNEPLWYEGDVVSQELIGGVGYQTGNSVFQATDDSCVVAGYSNATNLPGTTNHGSYDLYLLKLNAYRINITPPAPDPLIWQRLIGGSSSDFGYSIEQTSDDGYIVAGSSNSPDISGTTHHGNNDLYIVKLDASGNIDE